MNDTQCLCLSLECAKAGRHVGDCPCTEENQIKNAAMLEFLIESNKIEDVDDPDSLIQALYAWDYLSEQKKLSRSVILKTHKILMLHQHLMPNERGYFRQCNVQVGGHIKLSWQSVPYAITELVQRIEFIADVKYSDEDLETMNQSLHVQFEDIHPFVDGNGRVGRMIMNWWRLSRGLPILVIKASERLAYYKWFE